MYRDFNYHGGQAISYTRIRFYCEGFLAISGNAKSVTD